MLKIRVVLADNFQLIRQGICALLEKEPDLAVVAEVADGLELLKIVEETQPNIVLLEVVMPNLSGLETITLIRQRQPRVQMVVLSMHKSLPYVLQSLNNGAMGYVLKSDSINHLTECIRTVHAGGRYLSPQLPAEEINIALKNKVTETPTARRLSWRERQVLQLLAEGNTNQKIAEKLSVSRRTVETHRANLMHKLKLNTQAEAVQYAIQHGMIGIDRE